MSEHAGDVSVVETSSAAAQLLTWLRPFGVHSATTGLELFEGAGPAERGLRTAGHVHITTQLGRLRDECDPTDTDACSCCAASTNTDAGADAPAVASAPVSAASPPVPYGCSSCARCFPTAPLHAPMISIPAALLITPLKLLSLFLVGQHRLGIHSKWAPYLRTLPRSYTSIEWWDARELDSAQCPPLVDEAARRRCSVRREWKQVCEWIRQKHPLMPHADVEGLEHQAVPPPDNANFAKQDDDDDDSAFLPLHWLDSISDHCCPPRSSSPPAAAAATPSRCGSGSLCTLPSLAEFQWAWSSVSTRSCFLPPSTKSDGGAKSFQTTKSNGSGGGGVKSKAACRSADPSDSSCLIPYLDMLNHSSRVSVSCRLEPSGSGGSGGGGGVYQLWCASPRALRLHPGAEMFISYGALSNRRLLERYGFALPDNAHECIKIALPLVESFLRAGGGSLPSEADERALRAPWDHAAEFDPELSRCSCAARVDVASMLATKLPRYARPLPGFAPKMEPWQLELLRACGLYDLAEQAQELSDAAHAAAAAGPKAAAAAGRGSAAAARINRVMAATSGDATAAAVGTTPASAVSKPFKAAPPSASRADSASSHSFTLEPCALPFDLATYVRVRVLSAEDAKTASAAAAAAASNGKGRGSKPAAGGRGAAAAIASSSASIDVPTLAAHLLDESSPYVSASHRLLSQRVLLELLQSLLRDPSGLGRSSLQSDLAQWSRRTLPPAPLSYVDQQALALRITEKRLLHCTMAHVIAE